MHLDREERREQVVRREQPDLVLMGKQAVDDDANQTGQMLAGRLGWPQATFISKIEIDSQAKEAVCTRETDAGVEVIVVDLPAVITADLRLNEPRYVSLPSLIKARRRSIEVTTAEELGVRVQPRTGVVSYRVAPRRAKGIMVADVQELLTRLRDNDKVI
jgi:electron transfer flavoprotein beta subunit